MKRFLYFLIIPLLFTSCETADIPTEQVDFSVSIGPLCPVQTASGNPCGLDDAALTEIYASYKLMIYDSKDELVLNKSIPYPGDFQETLPIGNLSVSIFKESTEITTFTPSSLQVSSNGGNSFEISIDTGIR